MAERITIADWVAKGQRPELAEVFAAIARAGARIAGKIRLAGLDDIYGVAGATNVQGEQQQKLDVFANDVVTDALRDCAGVVGLVSEEDAEPILLKPKANEGKAHFVVCFDPLDGSSNIDVNVNVGTIFGIRQVEGGSDVVATVLRPGSEQVGAGYIVYGPSVVFVATTGDSVAAFTLDDDGEFLLSSDAMSMPEQGPYYSANEANAATWPEPYSDFLTRLLDGELGGKPYSARYVGSLVADFHRTLLKGGIFFYPPSDKAPEGKLRLQYEANPLALLAEAAGGGAVNGAIRVLDLPAHNIHGRTPLVVGSRREVDMLQRLVKDGTDQ